MASERKAALDSGIEATKNLAECLAVDQAVLVATVLPRIGLDHALDFVLAAQGKVSEKGISHQIAGIGLAIGETLLAMRKRQAAIVLDRLCHHASDTVRSWAAFAVTRADSSLTLGDRLDAIFPFAADVHFGVREWAWMAVRPYIAAEIDRAVLLLLDWTGASDANIRRFAVESIRPRGVWSEHIARLKTSPEIAEPLLEALKADEARYVQDSVANWLNDASKTSPEWVLELCEQWRRESNPATDRIVDRALRTLRKKGRVIAT
ncbi:DNA alkylation repair protein [Burkholderia sp. Bp8963]|nr:DNA alkylation repair protein [Burkholderia sp. Bp8963]